MSRPFLTPLRWKAAIGVALLALALSLYARRTSAVFQATHEPSACVVSPAFDCDAVMNSKYARLLGISVSTLGAAGMFLLLAVLAIARRGSGPVLVAGTLSLLFALFSLAYFGIATFLVGSGCIVCMGIQALSVMLALLLVPPGIRAASEPIDRAALRFAGVAGAIALVLAVAGEEYANETSRAARMETREDRPAVWIELADTVVYGNANAQHKVLVYSDFGCPICYGCFLKARALTKKYPDDVVFLFKHWPLDTDCNPKAGTNKHAGACMAARAAQAAASKGKSVQAIDFLFDDATSGFNSFALKKMGRRLGMEKEEWSRLLKSPEIDALVARDVEEGHALDLGGVPAVFIDGRRVDHNRLTKHVEAMMRR